MAHLIDKSALVAEIERRIKVLQKNPYENHKTICHLDSLKQSIDTLEVKDVEEEPVSEDLEEEIIRYIGFPQEVDEDVSTTMIRKAAHHFANWQKKQDQSTIELAEDHAMLAGMDKMKEQMMAKAIDVEVKVDAGGYPYIDKTIELYDYDKDVPLAKAGEKVKVIIMKEEKTHHFANWQKEQFEKERKGE